MTIIEKLISYLFIIKFANGSSPIKNGGGSYYYGGDGNGNFWGVIIAIIILIVIGILVYFLFIK